MMLSLMAGSGRGSVPGLPAACGEACADAPSLSDAEGAGLDQPAPSIPRDPVGSRQTIC
jgi:hypothetical protein